ncbi:MAG: type II toxin-antitoxin system VapC family toxin [Candidatus Thermoplasmatota archaeon]
MRLKIYLDTSVFSAYHDDRDESRQMHTKEFWGTLSRYDRYISEIVLQELGLVSSVPMRKRLVALTKDFRVLKVDKETERLAEEYIERGILPNRYMNDALHIAAASKNKIDILVSWNFRHIVKRKTRLQVNLVNSLLGYGHVDLIAPPEL